jgi:hypothetical protein
MSDDVITQVTTLVDKAINEISGRELVASAEMVDLLLDIRLLLLDTEAKEIA